MGKTGWEKVDGNSGKTDFFADAHLEVRAPIWAPKGAKGAKGAQGRAPLRGAGVTTCAQVGKVMLCYSLASQIRC